MANENVWTIPNVSTEAEAYRHFPEGFILRSLFSSAHMGKAAQIAPKARVLDIGTFRANNLVPFHDRGCECHGIDINEDMVSIARKHAALHGMRGTFSVGANRAIPYQAQHFDIVLSIATLHYETSLQDVRAALSEMRRVLKPDGCLLLSTIGPQHHMLQDAEPLSLSRYRAGKSAGLRVGETFTVFNSVERLANVCLEFFPSVMPATITEHYANTTFQIFVVRCA